MRINSIDDRNFIVGNPNKKTKSKKTIADPLNNHTDVAV